MTIIEPRPVHSTLGASGAERWMACPGSVTLLKHLDLPPEGDEPDYRAEGTAAHEVAATCLQHNLEAWETIGTVVEGVEITQEIAGAVQVYLDEIAAIRKNCVIEREFIETPIERPDVHKMYYGTVDYAAIARDRGANGEPVGPRMLIQRDYKHGEGVVVEADDNPQCKYYAFGILQFCEDVEIIDLGIVQPRAFHPDGPIRTAFTSADVLRAWVQEELVPAMVATEMDSSLDAGKWCRFCPAKLVCPMMKGIFGAAMKVDPREHIHLTDEEIGRQYQYLQAAKQYARALEEEAFRRLNLGRACPGVKLVNKKANRVFNAGADQIFKARFGEKAFTEPKLKTPAEMEKLDAEAKALVKKWAHTPNTGLTVALESDKRPAVKVQSSQETFGAAVAAMNEQQ